MSTPATIITGAATPEEAAAISAAVSRFVNDTSVAPPAEGTGMDPWTRAALTEGVGAKSLFGPDGAANGGSDPF